MHDRVFEDCFFNRVKRGFHKKRHNAFSSDVSNFEEEVNKNILNFKELKRKDPKVKVTQVNRGYKVKLSKPHLAFSINELLSGDNPDIDLSFSEDLLEYTPDDELVKKSKVPLWIIKPVDGGSSVYIQRLWAGR